MLHKYPAFQDPPVSQDEPDSCWETFHENSKSSRYEIPPSDHEVLARMEDLAESLEYHGYGVQALFERAPLEMTLDEAIARRATTRNLAPARLSLQAVAAVLHCAYGQSRDERDKGYPRIFRTVPSGGALYPLELYLHYAGGANLAAGLYHYNPVKSELRLLRPGDHRASFSGALAQPELAEAASLVVFITAMFQRSTYKYGDRGYRFCLLEAGHVAQNINLAAEALGLGSVNIGGYYDRQIDDFLDLDGLTQSTVYMVAVGAAAQKA